jgi:hypothetical protein
VESQTSPATPPPDLGQLRISLTAPGDSVLRALGSRPSSFTAREAWVRDAAQLVAHDIPDPSPTPDPVALDDLGLDI